MADAAVTCAGLLADLARIGLRRGDRVAVHSSYRVLGPVEGGPATVIAALMETVTDAGLIVMPAFQDYPVPVFRARETKSDCGVITELFRLMPGVFRSLHPSHSTAAWGERAEWIAAAHEAGRTALGVDSPFDRLAQLEGKVLLLGVGQTRNSMVHVGEAHVRPAYLPIPFSPEFAFPVLMEDRSGRVRSVRIEECPGCSENFEVVGARLRERGQLIEDCVANGPASLMKAADVLAAVRDLLAERPDALLCARPACPFCPAAREALRKERAG
jgi:aminoglycoside 3-N-acetyltransferase